MVALIILALLLIIGTIATRTTTTEVQLATSETRHKDAFYNADGVSELGSELLEQNIACPMGFTANNIRGGLIEVEPASIGFWRNTDDDATTPSDTNRDFFLPTGYTAGQPHTNVKIGGNAVFSTGSALQIAAGYEGKGKSIVGGGAYLVYDQIAQHVGRFNAESIVWVQYRHVIGNEGSCDP